MVDKEYIFNADIYFIADEDDTDNPVTPEEAYKVVKEYLEANLWGFHAGPYEEL